MNVLIFGASGMVGRGVLREALENPSVTTVISVARTPLVFEHPKLTQITHLEFTDFSALANSFTGIDACFWCLGIPSMGVDEKAYTRITHGFTLAAAHTLARVSPECRFCFVSAAGADVTEAGKSMWARVKGKTENELRPAGFKDVIVFQPGYIRAMYESTPRGTLLRITYFLFVPFGPLARLAGWGTSTVEIGKAMIAAGQGQAEGQILLSRDINRLAAELSNTN